MVSFLSRSLSGTYDDDGNAMIDSGLGFAGKRPGRGPSHHCRLYTDHCTP